MILKDVIEPRINTDETRIKHGGSPAFIRVNPCPSVANKGF